MKVYKFGGASVKNANGVKNLYNVLQQIEHENVILVVSAMGKMTNAFENIVNAYFNNAKELLPKIDIVRNYHYKVLNDLFTNKEHNIFIEVNQLFIELSSFLINNKKKEYNFVYDQIVPIAEQIATKIISTYLLEKGITNNWIDARKYIKTNTEYREAKVIWEATQKNIEKLKERKELQVTQGFIGSDSNNNTTTLGREGSDYTAGIFAYCLNAESVSIFKDVAGVLNADPNVFSNTILLEQISYREAIEMAFYGASVMHPKTLQPLQKKEIPLYVKSFKEPRKDGTTVGKGVDLKPKTPCYIVKNNQILISIATRDFSFMMEDNISEIFTLLHQNKLRVNLIQNTAISFSVCLEDKYNNFETFLKELKVKYKGLYNKNTSLLTIRHFEKEDVDKIEKENKVLLKQTSRETVQFVIEREYKFKIEL